MDMRIGWDIDIHHEYENSLETIRKNMLKNAMISFLEDPNYSDCKKQEIILDPASASVFDSKNNSVSSFFRIPRGFCIEAGGLWKDWDDALFLLL